MNINDIVTVVYCMVGGVFAAFLVSYATRAFTGAFVDALLSASAFSPESAKTLEELGVKKNIVLSYSLSHNKTLRRLVICEDGRWYSPTDSHEKLRSIFGRERISILTPVVAVVLLIAIILFIEYGLPLIKL